MDKPRLSVLVVDDELPVRRLIMRTLKRHGIDPIGATDGLGGLEAFVAHRREIGLVILDLLMPGMSGLDLAAELERCRPGINILYISGLGDSIAMESILQQSADRVLLKPFTPAALVERVVHLLAIGDVQSAPCGRNWTPESA